LLLKVEQRNIIAQHLSKRPVEDGRGLNGCLVKMLSELAPQVKIAVLADGLLGVVAAKIGRDEAGYAGRHGRGEQRHLGIYNDLAQTSHRRHHAPSPGAGLSKRSRIC
jgi:hypothetical protein